MIRVEGRGEKKDWENASLKFSLRREVQVHQWTNLVSDRQASALCLWAGELTSSGIPFFTCKMRIIILTSRGCEQYS